MIGATSPDAAGGRISARLGVGAGAVALALVAACCVLSWRPNSPLVPRSGGVASGATATGFLVLLALAFVAYVVGVVLIERLGGQFTAVAVIAAAIQLAPLFAPLLLSTDAWTYWAYGRVAAIHDANPYVTPPSAYPDDPAVQHMGVAWRSKTTVYGPAFTLASEPVAHAVGNSANAAAWIYKALAAFAALAATALAAGLTRRRTVAIAFVGWNPILAVHLAGGGHNDAWVGALVLAALALAARGRLRGAGAFWVLATAVKWVPLVFVSLHTLAAAPRVRRSLAIGLLVAGAIAAVIASWRYGIHWTNALAPLAENARLETSYALPHRLQGIGLSRHVALGAALVALAAGLLWAVREALRGRARLALVACLLLATTPYLAVWYLGWAVPLAGVDEDDRVARVVTLVLCAYLLPQTIPH